MSFLFFEADITSLSDQPAMKHDLIEGREGIRALCFVFCNDLGEIR